MTATLLTKIHNMHPGEVLVKSGKNWVGRVTYITAYQMEVLIKQGMAVVNVDKIKEK